MQSPERFAVAIALTFASLVAYRAVAQERPAEVVVQERADLAEMIPDAPSDAGGDSTASPSVPAARAATQPLSEEHYFTFITQRDAAVAEHDARILHLSEIYTIGVVVLTAISLLIVLGVLLHSDTRRRGWTRTNLAALVVPLICGGALVLVSAGFSKDQMLAPMTLFGTIVGYLLGNMTSTTPATPDPNAPPPPPSGAG